MILAQVSMAFLPNDLYSAPQHTSEHIPYSSYSHGLEKIYALETVDPSSIRKIAISSIPGVDQKVTIPKQALTQDQLEFNYGQPFESQLESFIFREPIQVLGYSRRIEKWLTEQGKLILKDLLEDDLETPIRLMGIGQGHFDEIANKLQHYLKANALTPSQKIDFTSWLKTILADIEPKKSAALLDSFQLHAIIPLSPAENAELRKFTQKQREETIQEAISDVCTEQKKQNIFKDVQHITESFIKPWLYQRACITNQQEIIDQLLKLSHFHSDVEKILHFISSTYFESHFLFDPFLFTVDEGLYCHNLEFAEAYYDIMQTAHSYFYRHDLVYPLTSLLSWIKRELAKNWRGFPDNFVERTLRLSRNFRIRKDFSGQLTIKLS